MKTEKESEVRVDMGVMRESISNWIMSPCVSMGLEVSMNELILNYLSPTAWIEREELRFEDIALTFRFLGSAIEICGGRLI